MMTEGMQMQSTDQSYASPPRSVDEYITRASDRAKPMLLELRETIRKNAPVAEERISYQMPAYFLNGALVYFGAFKSHVSLFGTASGLAEIFKEELTPYKVSKGTIQFPLDKPLPSELIARIVQERVRQNLAKDKRR